MKNKKEFEESNENLILRTFSKNDNLNKRKNSFNI